MYAFHKLSKQLVPPSWIIDSQNANNIGNSCSKKNGNGEQTTGLIARGDKGRNTSSCIVCIGNHANVRWNMLRYANVNI